MRTKSLKVGVPLETDDVLANLSIQSGGNNWECRSALRVKSVGDGTEYNDKYAQNSRLATVAIARKDAKGPDYALNIYDEGTARGLFSVAYDGQCWLYHNKLNCRFADFGAYDSNNLAVVRASRFDNSDVPICQILEWGDNGKEVRKSSLEIYRREDSKFIGSAFGVRDYKNGVVCDCNYEGVLRSKLLKVEGLHSGYISANHIHKQGQNTFVRNDKYKFLPTLLVQEDGTGIGSASLLFEKYVPSDAVNAIQIKNDNSTRLAITYNAI